MNQKFVSSRQLLLLPRRIRKAEATEASKEVYRFLWNKCNSNNMKIMVVGAGGSYPAAVCASHSIRDELRIPYVDAATPQTALRILSQTDRILSAEHRPRYDVVIGISYSGKTPDIKAVYEYCKERNFPFVLFTGANKETLKKEYFENELLKIVSYFNAEDTTGKERGMISMFSTLAPAVLFDDQIKNYDFYRELLKKGKQFVSKLDIPKIASAIKSRPVIHVIYEWRTYAIAADIASKFMESGIANVILHEKKNFSHGCYTLLYKQSFGMVINLTKFDVGIGRTDLEFIYNNDYDAELDKFFKDICNEKEAIYMELGKSIYRTATVLIEEMCKLPYLVTAIGEELGIDISKPFGPDELPEEAETLYRFEGEF